MQRVFNGFARVPCRVQGIVAVILVVRGIPGPVAMVIAAARKSGGRIHCPPRWRRLLC